MTDWVRFHRELCDGDKRGLPRATRFVYMELSRLARLRKGWIPLPDGMSDLDGVCDLLGGNHDEVTEAVPRLAKMIKFGLVKGKRAVVVSEWKKWNPYDKTAGKRQAAKRARDAEKYPTAHASKDDGTVTRDTSVSNGEVTDPRARALISSPLSSSDLSEGETGESERPSTVLRISDTRAVGLRDPLSDELRSSAQMLGVQAMDACWLKFCGTYAGQTVHVPGKWQTWCVNEANRERLERDRPKRAGGGFHEPDRSRDPSTRKLG